MSASIIEWISQQLTVILGIDTPDDIAQYIFSIENQQDVEEYLKELLDGNDPKSKVFIRELLARWSQYHIPSNVQMYRKIEEDDSFYGGSKSKQSKKKEKKVISEKDDLSITKSPEKIEVPSKSPGGKKQKYVPLFSEDGNLKTAAKLPGRHPCECQASKHKLVNNCVACGRVICEQEGSGPCYFCGTLVCSPEELEILSRGTKKSSKLKESLMKQGLSRASYLLNSPETKELPNRNAQIKKGFETAKKHKDKLLEYDRTSVKRTQVIDDESDYYSVDSNTWLSKTEKQALQKREAELRDLRHGSRLNKKVTLDFAGRRVVDDQEAGLDMYSTQDSVIQEVYFGVKSKNEDSHPEFDADEFGTLVNPGIQSKPPQFVSSEKNYHKKIRQSNQTGVDAGNKSDQKKKSRRLQDADLQQMVDEGMCLSMHQPWASLLTNGIKIHEGRSWYTSHRGRLWIAATAKTPSADEIDTVEEQYRMQNHNLEFPKEYPTSCLLGCVDLDQCLTQEEYREQFPGGESACPYVFICSNPKELLLKFPIKGRHKIYKLQGQTHQAAKKGLRATH